MIGMREVNLRSVDLNLLTILQVLLEEQHVTRAAERLHMSQSAVSRALQRLRLLFNDPLLVKGVDGYSLSSRANKIATELTLTLQTMSRFIREPEFDLATDKSTIRLAGVDLEGWINMPELVADILQQAPRVRLEVSSNPADYFALLGSGEVDLLVSGMAPSRAKEYFHCAKLGNSELAVMMGKNNPLAKGNLDLDRYLKAEHGYVTLTGKGPTFIDDQLETMGLKRNVVLKISHFLSVVDYCERTNILFMLPVELINGWFEGRDVVIKPLPKQLFKPKAEFFLYWHARSDTDQLHRWIREKIITVKQSK